MKVWTLATRQQQDEALLASIYFAIINITCTLSSAAGPDNTTETTKTARVYASRFLGEDNPYWEIVDEAIGEGLLLAEHLREITRASKSST